MGTRVMGLVLGALLFGAGTGWAQVAWDSPLFVPPRPEPGLGVYLIDATNPGEIGVVGTWRPANSPRLGFRAGIADALDVTFLAGADYSQLLTTASDDFPLDIGWVIGAGASISDILWLSFPLGLTLGRTFTEEEVNFTPFASPRVVLDVVEGDANLDLAVDIGLDLAFDPDWTIRFSGTFGDREAVGVGVVF